MRAIILAGGKGTRLRPYTTLIPKPLVPLGGKYSILEIILMQLKRSGFTHVTLAVNHLSNLIMAYFGDGSRLGLKLDYSLEEGELSTIGPLTLIEDLPENFLVMNGDILCDLDYRAFFETHVQTGSRVSVSAYRR
jgi:NDP-sugar pyrophosphorylase family protein